MNEERGVHSWKVRSGKDSWGRQLWEGQARPRPQLRRALRPEDSGEEPNPGSEPDQARDRHSQAPQAPQRRHTPRGIYTYLCLCLCTHSKWPNSFILSLSLCLSGVQVLASKSKIYMVLEYVTGGELFDVIVSAHNIHIQIQQIWM